MKNLFKVALLATAIFTATQGHAQTVGQKVDTTAKKVGHKTAQIAAKGDAAVTDKRYKDKVGPHGETIYINKHAHYFYVNKAGHRVYLKKSELRDK